VSAGGWLGGWVGGWGRGLRLGWAEGRGLGLGHCGSHGPPEVSLGGWVGRWLLLRMLAAAGLLLGMLGFRRTRPLFTLHSSARHFAHRRHPNLLFLPCRRNHVLATVYMARSDVAYTVRTGEHPPAWLAACLPACPPACLPACPCQVALLLSWHPHLPLHLEQPHGSHHTNNAIGQPNFSPLPPPLVLPPLYCLPAAALHVWKTVVTNTPKTLGELLPALMAIIIESLADPGGWVGGCWWVAGGWWVLAVLAATDPTTPQPPMLTLFSLPPLQPFSPTIPVQARTGGTWRGAAWGSWFARWGTASWLRSSQSCARAWPRPRQPPARSA
jgi:hypothetical protein